MNNAKKVFDWFKDLFTKSKEKGFGATLMGPFVGFLRFLDTLGKKEEKPAPTETARPAETTIPETKAQLEQLQSSLSAPFDASIISSNPFRKDEKTGVTLCSLTAKLNLDMLAPGKRYESIRADNAKKDIQRIRDEAKAGKYRIQDVIPTGNADDIEQFYLEARGNELITGNTEEKIQKLNASGKTVCDIVTFSTSQYGHRSVGFKGTDGRWYALDPYRYEGRTKPIPFEEYTSKYGTDIKFIIPIESHGWKPTVELAKSEPARRVLTASSELLLGGMSGINCWNWAAKVYERAGVGRNVVFRDYDTYEGRDCGDHHAREKELAMIEPGDHLFINNKNTKDAHGNHSVIFLRWIGPPENQEALTAGLPGEGDLPRIGKSDLKKTPVTCIIKPTEKSGGVA